MRNVHKMLLVRHQKLTAKIDKDRERERYSYNKLIKMISKRKSPMPASPSKSRREFRESPPKWPRANERAK